jgi:hypothetical protein
MDLCFGLLAFGCLLVLVTVVGHSFGSWRVKVMRRKQPRAGPADLPECGLPSAEFVAMPAVPKPSFQAVLSIL